MYVVANNVVDVVRVDPPLGADSQHGEDEAVGRKIVRIWHENKDDTEPISKKMLGGRGGAAEQRLKEGRREINRFPGRCHP